MQSSSRPICWPALAILAMVSVAIRLEAAGQVSNQLRRPVALRLSTDERQLYVANRASGSISQIDIHERKLVGEFPVGKQLSDFATLDDGSYLVTDEAAHELVLLSAAGERLEVRSRLSIAPYPVSIAISPDRQTCAIASLWTRRITFVDIRDRQAGLLKPISTLDLTFAPRCQTFTPDGQRLIVADSFSGRLGIVSPRENKLLFVREFPAHNIRGLSVNSDGNMLIVAHQMLNELAHTINNDVHWGLLMSNDLRWLKLESVLDENASLFAGAHMHPLGQAGNATADPSGVSVAKNGIVVVSTGGVGEIAIGKEDDFSLYRIEVGKRPTASVLTRDAEFAFVANTFGESVSIVNVPEREQVAQISLGPRTDLTLAQKGELLFYNARVSHDGWMSCHSCHTDGHTNGLVNDNFSDKSFGSAKQVLSLLGRKGTAPFAWNGQTAELGTQVKNSIVSTMQGAAPSDETVAAIVAYVDSLSPPPPIDVLRGTQDIAAVQRGEKLFETEGCKRCHAPPFFTTPETYDVGIYDKQGQREFNPPSLLGVGQRGPYFHDNRAKSLDDVLGGHRHQLDRALSDDELRDLTAFLRSL